MFSRCEENVISYFTENLISVYTDGSCIGKKSERNAGSGVYFGEYDVRNISVKVPDQYNQTNQVAELYAIFLALQQIREHFKEVYHGKKILIYSDSIYSINCLTVWSKVWIQNGWKTSTKKDVCNRELIEKTHNLLSTFNNIDLKYIKAHNGHFGNEAADRLAKQGAAKRD